jgi:dihydroorotate dehydrogenase electron transfer subunit
MQVPFDGEIRAGQFFMLRAAHAATLLPRPISVCDVDRERGILTFLYQVVGRGTAELAALSPGDKLTLTGPLGNGFPLETLEGKIEVSGGAIGPTAIFTATKRAGHIALVGGGIGLAPLLLTARKLRAQGCTVDCLAGFRDEPFLLEELRQTCDRVEIATESGRVGVKGYVTALLHPQHYDTILCCGPLPMMKAVTAMAREAGTPLYVSLENKMACGIGGCLVCTCTDRNGKNRRTCVDGPVFRGEEIDYEA